MLVWLTMAGVWIADRLLKILIQGHFLPGESLVLVPKLLHLTLVLNPGAAFGLLAGRTWVFVGTACIVTVGVVYAQFRVAREQILIRLALGMIGGGALGNLYDRVTLGTVVDYVDVRLWPYVFNFADSMIVIGVGLLLIAAYLGDKRAIKKGSESAVTGGLGSSSSKGADKPGGGDCG